MPLKQILFMMPSYYNFDEVVIEGLTKYSGYTINSIDTVDKRVYKNSFSKIINFLSKVLLNKNLKPEMRRRYFFHAINKFSSYEYLIVNRPDILSDEILTKAISASKKSILLLWDSLEKIPISEKIISKFNVTYSFDIADCKRYGFKKIENFHFYEPDPDLKKVETYDVVYLGTLDDRIHSLKPILAYLSNEGKKSDIHLYIPPNKRFKKHSNIKTLRKTIPFKESSKFALYGKTILDIGHTNQTGLSFRFFEAMAFRKKIITTNKYVIHYDFYNENNIFVIDDVNNINIPKSFWDSEYYELPEHIVEKYHIKNWVKKVIDER